MKPTLIIDIETKADKDLFTPEYMEEMRADISAPSNWKDPFKIAAFQTDAVDKAVAKGALHAQTGRVVSIAWAYMDGDEEIYNATGDDEAEVFRAFKEALPEDFQRIMPKPVIAGAYVRKFDLPFIAARSCISGVHLPCWWPHARDWRMVQDVVDILGDGKLDEWLRAFGLKRKTAKGSEVAGMSLAEIAQYNRDDVESTRELFRRIGHLCPNIREVDYV